jgi:hypothetical protein
LILLPVAPLARTIRCIISKFRHNAFEFHAIQQCSIAFIQQYEQQQAHQTAVAGVKPVAVTIA